MAIAGVLAALKVAAEHFAYQPRLNLFAIGTGPPYDAMRVKRVGRNFERVEIEGNAFRCAQRNQTLMSRAKPILVSELVAHIFTAVRSFRRDGRVKLERAPADVNLDVVNA